MKTQLGRPGISSDGILGGADCGFGVLSSGIFVIESSQ
jgi:hypothetical protein